MPAPIIDSNVVAAELDRLRSELPSIESDPVRAREYGERLSRLGATVTAACESAFLRLTETPAA